MMQAHKQKHSTLNHITRLLTTRASDVPIESRPDFLALRAPAQAKWLYPYTVENTMGTADFAHWRTNFNPAVIQRVTAQFEKEHRVTKEGKDLYAQGGTTFAPDARIANAVSAKALQICQPLLLNHMYI